MLGERFDRQPLPVKSSSNARMQKREKICKFPISYSSPTRRKSSCLRSTQFRKNTGDVDLLQREKKTRQYPTLHRKSRAKWSNHTPTNDPSQNVKGSLKHRFMLLFDQRMRRDINIPLPCIDQLDPSISSNPSHTLAMLPRLRKEKRERKKEEVQFTIKIQENSNPGTYASSMLSSLWLERLTTVRRPGQWRVSRAKHVALYGQCSGMNGKQGRLFKWVAYVESNPAQS